jgi:hypothetical protein
MSFTRIGHRVKLQGPLHRLSALIEFALSSHEP